MRPAGGICIGRLFGVQICADWSLLVVFVLVAFNLAVGVFPVWHPTWGAGVTWAIALLASALFFASVLLHELSHALVGKAFGVPVESITLFIFGGMANIRREPPSAGAELAMAIVGPFTSIALGILCAVIGGVLVGSSFEAGESTRSLLSSAGPFATLMLWLGPINVILGVFNLIPGFPLDGGRVLRAALWAATKDIRKATRWASMAGQAVAWLLIAVGVSMAFGAQIPILGGGLVQGLWLVFIGWFLQNAAVASYQQVLLHRVLERVPVARVMRSDVTTVSPDITVEALVERYFMGTDQRAFPVVEDDRLIGLVCLQDVRKVSTADWPATQVRGIMTDSRALAVVTPSEDAAEALHALAQRDVDQVPVVEPGGRLRGMLRRRDLMRWIELHTAELPA